MKIISIGKQKKSPYFEMFKEYLKRISPFAKIEVVELSETKFSSKADREKTLATEAQKIKKTLNKQSFVIVLDAQGEQMKSETFAARVDEWANAGATPLTFVIGGPLGLHDEIKKEADQLLSLSSFTMPHDLAHLVLAEQLYRAITILKDKTYHY